MKKGERLTFAQFWPHYLREHSNPATRAMHLTGTVAAMVLLVVAVVARGPWLVVVALLAGDLAMLGFAARGKLSAEVRKAIGPQ